MDGRAILVTNSDLQNVLSELLNAHVSASKMDESTHCLAEAIARLNQDTKGLGFAGVRVAAGQRNVLCEARQELWQGALG